MLTPSEERRLEELESKVAVILGTKGAPAPSAPYVGPGVVRPKADSLDQAIEYAYDGYAEDGVQGRWLGTHVGNLDEARQEVGTVTDAKGVYVLVRLLPTKNEKATAGFPPAWWNANATEAASFPTLEAWWAEVLRRREATSGTPNAGPSGG